MEALHRWETPRYLANMFDSYFSERFGSIESPSSSGGKFEVRITAGVSRGSTVMEYYLQHGAERGTPSRLFAAWLRRRYAGGGSSRDCRGC
ncbi:unnamed protein product [Macrosiphum euphorbiae]|uniref:Uncharacterized protein n=1 Tax=Macrosiphum euphorbiae TaxID=13131 RepID=A0AAV0WNH3_9HEMI|nr:unnamed protein product [Macrosiphum euphorbiae]